MNERSLLRVPAHLVGALTTLLPSLVPPLQIRFAFHRGVRRADAAWAIAVGALAAGALFHRVMPVDALIVLTTWGIARGTRRAPLTRGRGFGDGLVIGLVVALASAALSMEFRTTGRMFAPTIAGDPNGFAAAIVLLAALVTISAPSRPGKWIGIAVIVAALAGSGSRTAAVAFLALASILLLDRAWRKPVLAITLLAIPSIVLLANAFPDRVALQRLVPPLGAARSVNLLGASEDLRNRLAWTASGVEVTPLPSDGRINGWFVEKTAAVAWARPQQAIELEPNAIYTIGGEFKGAKSQQRIGVLAFGETSSDRAEVRVVRDGAEWILDVRGGVEGVRLRTATTEDGWQRIEATFRYLGAERLIVGFGPTPDQREASVGASVEVRALQVEEGTTASTYAPTRRPHVGGGEARSRLAIWSAALVSVRERPWLGWGSGRFPEIASAATTWRAVPAHAHNQPLDLLVSFGGVGLLAFVALWLALIDDVRCRRVLVPLALLNVTDATLLVAPTLFLVALATRRNAPSLSVAMKTGHADRSAESGKPPAR